MQDRAPRRARLASICIVITVVGTASSGFLPAQVLESRAAEAAIARSVIEAPGEPSKSDLILPGVRLEGVTLFSGYSSSAVPGSGLLNVSNLGPALGGDVDYGGQATFSWRRRKPRSSLGLVYTPRYTARARFPQWNRTDHQLSFAIATAPTARWNLDVSASAGLFGSEQLFFNSAVFRSVSNPPATLSDLIAGTRAGQFSDEEIASILTGAPILESPGGTDLDLSRAFNAGGSITASYSYSRRLSLNFGASTSRYEFLSGRRELGSTDARTFFPGATTVNGDSGVSYRVSSRTTIGAGVSGGRSYSGRFPGTAYVSETAFWTHQVARKWSVGVQGGHGLSQVSSGATGPGQAGTFHTWVAGGNAGYSGAEHSLSTSVNRSVADFFGVGAQTMTSTGATWRWRPRGKLWSVDGNVSGMVNRVPGFDDLTTWTSALGYVRMLNDTTIGRWEYSYGDFSSQFVGLFTNLTRHRVQFSLTWIPSRGPMAPI